MDSTYRLVNSPHYIITRYGIFAPMGCDTEKPWWYIIKFDLSGDGKSSCYLPGAYTLQQAQDLIQQWQGMDSSWLY